MKKKILLLGEASEESALLRSILTQLKYSVIDKTFGSRPLDPAPLQGGAPDLIVIDLRGTDVPRWELLAEARERRGDAPIVVVGDKKNEFIVTAMKMGASDYLSAPFGPGELKEILLGMIEEKNLVSEISHLSEIAKDRPSWLFSSCGPAMGEIKKIIDRIAGTDVTVLIRGESGTGKGVIARAIYSNSKRREKAFVKVNCAALPKELLESELFGYEKGAFTGAYQQKAGKFGLAHEGTIFLDEIGAMSGALQAKLLHVLETGEFCRLGGERNEKVDVRILAAAGGDLESAVRSGLFREDLFYRLNVVSVQIPPLRERKEELPVLAEYFLRQYGREYNKPYRPLSAETLSAFLHYDWPGNVRELENFVKRIVILGDERCNFPLLFSRASAGGEGASSFSLKQVSRQVSKKVEGEVIRKVLNQTRWNRRKAAEILKISYRSLLYKIKESGLEAS